MRLLFLIVFVSCTLQFHILTRFNTPTADICVNLRVLIFVIVLEIPQIICVVYLNADCKISKSFPKHVFDCRFVLNGFKFYWWFLFEDAMQILVDKYQVLT